MKIKARYELNKSAKVGAKCICPSCGTSFIKQNYQQAFCKTKGGTICKDKYWNTVDPKKRNNTTRISPANAAWQATQMEERGSIKKRYTSEGYEIIHGVAYDKFGNPVYSLDPYDDTHPFSGEGLGQW